MGRSRENAYENLTEESIVKRVNEIIQRASVLHGLDFYLSGIGDLKGRNTKLYFHCNIHNTDTETTYAKFKDTNRHNCYECWKEEYNKSLKSKWWLDRESTTNKILDTIKRLNSLGQDLTFLGYVENDPLLFKSVRFKIIIKCNKHNNIGTPRVDKFIRKGWYCEECTTDLIKDLNTITPEVAYSLAVQKCNPFFDYTKIIDSYTGYRNPVVVICPLHGPFQIEYHNLVRGRGVFCPICSEKSTKLTSENEVYSELLNYFSPEQVNRRYKIRVEEGSILKQTIITPDFYIKEKNIIIEYNGRQHYMFVDYFHDDLNGFVKQVIRDNYVSEYCEKIGIRLIKIPWVDKNRIHEILEELFTSGKDITTDIHPHLLSIVI